MTVKQLADSEKFEVFPLRSGRKWGYSLPLLLFNIICEGLRYAVRQEKIKGI